MTKQKSLFDEFLFRFDYSSKVRFIIYIGILSTIPMVYLLFQSQNLFLENLEKQKQGVTYLQEFNPLMKTMFEYAIKVYLKPSENTSEIKDIENKIDQLFLLLNHRMRLLKNDSPQNDSSEYYPLTHQFEILQLEWEEFKTDPSNKDMNLMDLLNSIETELEGIKQEFHFTYDFDIGTRDILLAKTNDLPKVKIGILQLLTLVKNFSNHLPLTFKQKADFNTKNYFFQQNSNNFVYRLKNSSEVNEYIKDQYFENLSLEELEEYLKNKKNFDNSLEKISNNFEISSPEYSTAMESGLKLLLNALDLSKKISPVLINILNDQSFTLKLRKIISISFFFFGVGIVLILYMSRVIRRPLTELKNAAEKLAEGDLSVRVEIISKDEVGQISQAFNKMAEFLESVMLKTNEISTHLANTSNHIFSTAKTLEENLANQEGTINQIANNAKGISRTVQDFAKSIIEVNNAATLTADLAILGRSSLAEMESIMQKMANASTHIVTTLSDLKVKIRNINTVINAIVKIADQINLLSLNTAIRAGKQGAKHLGFSVIAEKIRELADQTAYLTLDIEEVVQEIISSVMEASVRVGNCSSSIQNQLNEAAEIRESLKKLIAYTQSQITSFDTINVGMQEQTEKAHQIQDFIGMLMSDAHKTTRSVRNLYLEIEYLYHATNNLKSTTNKFSNSSNPTCPLNPSYDFKK